MIKLQYFQHNAIMIILNSVFQDPVLYPERVFYLKVLLTYLAYCTVEQNLNQMSLKVNIRELVGNIIHSLEGTK